VESAPRAYRLKASNAALPISTFAGAIPQNILHIIENMSFVMERSPSVFSNAPEETIRDHYLVQLNGQYEGQGTGETFNANGKTDILIRDGSDNIFIAECKVWRGPQSATDAVNQLLTYLTWRDTRAAIIIFNRNRDLSNVLTKIRQAIDNHPHNKRAPKVEAQTRFRYTFGKPDDANREITITVMIFDMPTANN
jgi:hypothetical protein